MDTNQSFYDSFAVPMTNNASIATTTSQVPEFMSTVGGGGGGVGHQLGLPVNANAARWASPDGDNSEPRIISEPLRSFAMHGNVDARTGATKGAVAAAATSPKSPDLRNGMVMTSGMPIMEQLTLECDPNAWDLPADSLEYHRMMGGHSRKFYCSFFFLNIYRFININICRALFRSTNVLSIC